MLALYILTATQVWGSWDPATFEVGIYYVLLLAAPRSCETSLC